MEDYYPISIIPKPAPIEAIYFRPAPGCFGRPGPIQFSTETSHLILNTTSFQTHNTAYEILVVANDITRRASAKLMLKIEEHSLPILRINCISKSLCHPEGNGVFVNTHVRLGLVATCDSHCEHLISYKWKLQNEENNLKMVQKNFPNQ